MKKILKISIICILSFIFGFLLFNTAYRIGQIDKSDCVIAKGIWGDQYIGNFSYNNITYCEECLKYSFYVQNKEFNYFAQNEHSLRNDLRFGDQIKVKLCWSDQVNGFLTKGVERIQ